MKVDHTANDNTPEALAAAARNYSLLINDWCDCGNPDSTQVATAAYYRNPVTGSHGWMCGNCNKIIQTG